MMGTFASLQKLYDNIVKSNAELGPAGARAETERYVSNVTTGISTTEVFYDLFDSAFAGSPHVRRFSGAERARRKAVSANVRQAMTGYVSAYADEKSTLPEAEPWLRNYLVPTGRGEHAEIYQEQNEKRQLEFQPDTEAGRSFVESYVANVIEHNPELSREAAAEQVKQELQKLRGDFTETLVLQSSQVVDALDQMLDPGLPPDRLSENIAKIMRAKRVNDCMEIYLEKASNGFMTVSADIKAMMEQQIKLRPRLTMAVNKLEAMANPMYEYFDVDRLGAYDVSAIRDVWKEEFVSHEDAAWRERKSRKHTHFNQYVTADIQDNFTSFLENAANYSEARQELSRRQLEEAVAEYGFDPGETHRFRETPSTVDSPDKKKQMQKTGATHTLDGRPNLHLYQDTPIAYYQEDRVVIFTPADTLTGLTTSRPEELYNYSFVGTTANLEKTLDDADRWYKTNKHGYGSMRRQLREITKMGKLPKEFTQNDIHRRKEAYQALLESSKTYLQSKGIQLRGGNAQAGDAQGRDDVERARIAAAKRAKAFAEMKMRELDLITNAKLTDIKRGVAANGNDDQINAAPAENQIGGNLVNENQVNQIGSGFMNEARHDLRENSPVRPLHQRYDKNFAKENQLPESLAKMMEGSLSELEWCWDHDALLEKDLESQHSKACDSFYRSLGAITAAEMVLAERKRMGGTGGPVERFFADAKKGVYLKLGYTVTVSFRGDVMEELEKVQTVLREFKTEDPRFDMKRYASLCEPLHAPMFQQDIAVRYRSDLNRTGDPRRDNALQQFVETHILNGLDKQIEQGFLEEMPMRENRNYLAACVVRDIVLLERGDDPAKEPGALEQKMMDSPEELIKDIKKFPPFNYKLDKKIQTQQGMYKVLSGNIMKGLAVEYVEVYNQKIRKDMENPDEANNGPKNKEADLEKQKSDMMREVWG